ncbi:MAG: maleylpyruvate isomerase family mycothiol-dependent enzyme [Labedaea sp.]
MDTRLHQTGETAPVANSVAYRNVRHNVTRMLTEHSPAEDHVVPACPLWTICDLLAHLAGTAALAIGRLSGSVPARRTPAGANDIVSLLGEWDWMGPEVERLLSDRAGNLLVMDSFTHELDLRYALGVPLPTAHPAFARALEMLVAGFSASVSAHGLPALQLVVDGTRWTVGVGMPVGVLTASGYDVYRSLAGRRSHEQITRLGWSRDSHRWLPAFTWGPFTPPEDPVEPAGGQPGR